MPTRKSKGQRATLLTLALLIPPLFPACPKNEPLPKPQARVSTAPRPTERLSAIPAAFNGERAMDHVKKQIEFGPRPPGSPQLEKTRTYIVNQLKSSGLNVSLDQFTAVTPQGEKNMANIVAELPGETKDLILITSHYDTKYFKDMLFVGANDPGASVGTLLEIGRVLGTMKDKPKLTYRLVFFDGEEAFCENWDDCSKPGAPDNTYGSRHYVTTLKAKNELSNTHALILLDMMGYTKLELGRDTMSTRWLQDIVWETARQLDHGDVFVERDEGVGGDDHEPFVNAGIASVDLIQLTSYPYWHKADDTIDKISAQSMKIVGDTVLASLPKIAEHLSEKTGSQKTKG
ncbi:MAG TPA: M28 family peptidase [Pyrinomonadaceae bacterium]|nr:M28 family peptidase [Pyrinomonadaceae bacterium]